ncbi:MAG: metallophosphoesterase [Chloroflexota bacterium]
MTELPPPLLTFVHISDTHIHGDPTHNTSVARFSSRVPVLNLIHTINHLTLPVDFVLHTGDIIHDRTRPEDYTTARELLDQLRYPVYYVAGNHDSMPDVKAQMAPNYDYPGDGAYYSVDVDGVQMIALDSTLPEEATGQIDGAQLAWLEALCEDETDTRPLIVAVHHHPLPTAAPWLDTIGMRNGDDLHATLLHARHRLRGVFYGHIHETATTVRDGISYYSVQSGWYQTQTHYNQQEPSTPAQQRGGFNLVTLTETDTFVRPVRL